MSKLGSILAVAQALSAGEGPIEMTPQTRYRSAEHQEAHKKDLKDHDALRKKRKAERKRRRR